MAEVGHYTQVDQVFGSASRETYILKLDVAGDRKAWWFARPTHEFDRYRGALEYGAYRLIHPTSVPVPEPLFLEEDESVLGAPFSLMSQIEHHSLMCPT